MNHNQQDYQGRPIPTDETLDTLIKVWEITPSLNPDYDSCVIREYNQAVQYVKHVVESLMDDPEIQLPIKVEIDVVEMPLGEFEELLIEDSYL